MNYRWLKERWFEFRSGHNLYLSFLISLTNFLLITYNFLVASFLKIDLWVFAILSLLLYVPLAVFVGHFHRTKQLPTDARVSYKLILDRLDEIETIIRGNEERKRKQKAE